MLRHVLQFVMSKEIKEISPIAVVLLTHNTTRQTTGMNLRATVTEEERLLLLQRQRDVRDVHAARATDPVAHAHWIVLTENAVGFENGGQRVPPDGKTNTLYVSRAATRRTTASRRPKGRRRSPRTSPASFAFLNSCVCPCVCVLVAAEGKTWVLFLAL